MTASQLRRLEAIEAELPEPQGDLVSAPWELLTQAELTRLRDGVERGAISDAEFQRWIDVAYERQAAGFTDQHCP